MINQNYFVLEDNSNVAVFSVVIGCQPLFVGVVRQGSVAWSR